VPLITGDTFSKEGRLPKIHRWGRQKTLLEGIKPMWRANLTLALKSLTFQYGVDSIPCSESHVVRRYSACCSCNRPVKVHTATSRVVHELGSLFFCENCPKPVHFDYRNRRPESCLH